jgi:hypothetical protein
MGEADDCFSYFDIQRLDPALESDVEGNTTFKVVGARER